MRTRGERTLLLNRLFNYSLVSVEGKGGGGCGADGAADDGRLFLFVLQSIVAEDGSSKGGVMLAQRFVEENLWELHFQYRSC